MACGFDVIFFTNQTYFVYSFKIQQHLNINNPLQQANIKLIIKRQKIKMMRLLQVGIFISILLSGTCYRSQQKFITFNTSSSKYVISTSISTNLDHEFSLYCPVLINTKDSIAQFAISEQKKKLVIEPKFHQENELLYNDYHEGEYWYSFKRSNDPEKRDTSATFAIAKLTVDQKTYDYFLPLYSLPLTFLSLSTLYKCDDVLIFYRRTDKMSDVTVFSAKEGWSLQPQATWGFRNRDENIYFSRQTYPLGVDIQVVVGENKYCVLNDQVKENTYNIDEKDIYSLNDLLAKYSTTLQVRDRLIHLNTQQPVTAQQDL